MKNFLLYFFALLLCLTLLPLAPRLFPFPKEQPEQACIHLLQSADGSIREIPLEDYVIGVLDAAGYPYDAETLKAIAVAVRSSALYSEQKHPVHENAAVCDDPNCCAAFSSEEFSEAAIQAAAETVGQVVAYRGEPIAALTHESSGAYTQSSLSLYGVDLPYLTEVRNVEEGRETTRRFEKQAFLSLLGASEADDADDLILAYDISGRVREARLGALVFSGQQLADRLSLPSCCFTLERTGDTVLAVCQGSGNGIGMSRNGASLLVREGKSYEDVLLFYYPGTLLQTLS